MDSWYFGTVTDIVRNFAVFEGGDGSGTTTQLGLLRARFPTRPVLYATAEPTDGPVGALIRRALGKELVLRPETLARLFAADRNEHLRASDGVLERCARGELVVSDRYALSSLAYQGIECGDDFAHALNADFPLPELLVFFDIDPALAAKRLKNRAGLEIYEYLEFQQLVREKYRFLLDEYREAGVRVEILDAAQSPEAVAAQVWAAILKMPIMHKG